MTYLPKMAEEEQCRTLFLALDRALRFPDPCRDLNDIKAKDATE
jgi:hypothetical protein